jgi:hypothetical protein
MKARKNPDHLQNHLTNILLVNLYVIILSRSFYMKLKNSENN